MAAIDAYHHLSFTCFDAGLDLVRDIVRESTVERFPHLYEEHSGPVDMRAVYEVEPPPTSRVGRRVLLFRSVLAPDWTTMLNNAQDGWMTLGFAVSHGARCRVLQFDLSSAEAEWQHFSFRVIDHGEERRVLAAYEDSYGRDRRRWVFFQKGVPVEIEDTARYAQKRVRARVSREYILSLARGMGFPADDDRYWTSDQAATYLIEPRPPKIGPTVYERITYDPH